jgi:hypothetical protein
MAYRLQIVPEGVAAEDGRGISIEALTWRTSPLPLMWTPAQGFQHEGAVVVGAFTDVHRATIDGTTGLVADTVVWDSGPAAMEAKRMVDEGTLRSLSADIDVDTVRVEMQGLDGASEWVEAGVLLGATLVPMQAFEWAQVVVDEDGMPEVEDEMVEVVFEDDLDMLMAAAEAAVTVNNTVTGEDGIVIQPEPEPLVAHALENPGDYDLPPVEWFATPEPAQDDDSVVWVNTDGQPVPAHTDGARPWGVPLTITADGRVYGHIASWQDCHTAYADRCVPPPKSHSDYAWFHTGSTLTADGEAIPTGRITVGTGHADRHLSAASAVAHYDNTGHAVSDVRAVDGELGPWVSGWIRPWATAQQRHELAAHPPSGDWRPRGGHAELLGVLAVNQPGFPMPRTVATFRKDQLVSLVASGLPPRAPVESDGLEARLAAVEARLDAAAILSELT